MFASMNMAHAVDRECFSERNGGPNIVRHRDPRRGPLFFLAAVPRAPISASRTGASRRSVTWSRPTAPRRSTRAGCTSCREPWTLTATSASIATSRWTPRRETVSSLVGGVTTGAQLLPHREPLPEQDGVVRGDLPRGARDGRPGRLTPTSDSISRRWTAHRSREIRSLVDTFGVHSFKYYMFYKGLDLCRVG